MAAEDHGSPINHSIDSDVFVFPFGQQFNIYETTKSIFGFGLTKFMFLQVVAASICILVFSRLAANIKKNGFPKGRGGNLFETMLLFLRDEIAVPAIGKHHAHHFLPFLWTMFFFILTCNLLGMVPWLGSPTAAMGCTLALSLCSLLMIHGSGMKELGVGKYLKSIVPPVPVALWLMMLLVELIGHTIRPIILAFRLFVNMVAGHTVLAVIMGFIVMVYGTAFYFFVTPLSIAGVVGLSLLELFVAFLQAYIFTFLSALFIGAAVHPHH